jgi:hypothetical protein
MLSRLETLLDEREKLLPDKDVIAERADQVIEAYRSISDPPA